MHRKQVTGWEVYKTAVDSFHPQKTFMSADPTSECRRNGLKMSNNSPRRTCTGCVFVG